MKHTLGAWLLLIGLLLAGCGGSTPQPTPTPTLTPLQAQGLAVFNSQKAKCATCHSLEPGVRIVGPSLAGIATRAAERVPGMDARTYIEMSILKPDAYIVEGYPNAMPSDLAKQLSGEEFDALVAFLLTLK